jgi:hypothetical protein
LCFPHRISTWTQDYKAKLHGWIERSLVTEGISANVTNLTQVFASGVVLTALANALLRAQGQDLKTVELSALSDSAQSNCNVAFVLLHEAGIPRILAPDDVAGELDERSMVVLLTHMYRSSMAAAAAARARTAR